MLIYYFVNIIYKYYYSYGVMGLGLVIFESMVLFKTLSWEGIHFFLGRDFFWYVSIRNKFENNKFEYIYG